MPQGHTLLRVLELALKIRALVRRGVDGEQKAAQNTLTALLEKNALTEVMLDKFELLKKSPARVVRRPVAPPMWGGSVVIINVGGFGPGWSFTGTMTGTSGSSTTTNGAFFS